MKLSIVMLFWKNTKKGITPEESHVYVYDHVFSTKCDYS